MVKMKSKTNLSRITIDMPTKDHKKLKAMAALLGKSMRELVIESIENQLKNETNDNYNILKNLDT